MRRWRDGRHTGIMRAMLVKDVGETKLIETLAEAVAEENAGCVESLRQRGFRLRLPIGDDAAAWDGTTGVHILTTDTMVEGVHFNLDQIGWKDLGWRSQAVNLSDVASMGCAPLGSAITLGLRGDLPVEGLVEMYRGMMEACQRHGGAIVGGDIVRSPVFFVTVALEGVSVVYTGADVHADRLLTRDSASVGDKIAVTGSLGCSGGGLRMLTEGLGFDEETNRHLREAHQRPSPRVDQGMALAQYGVATAIDISDGLVDDLGKLCEASGVAGVIRSERVPADEILRGAYPDDWLTLALSGGEDYELLFTAPPDVMDVVEDMLDVPVSVIGEIVEGPPRVTVLDREGHVMGMESGGWDHFRRL